MKFTLSIVAVCLLLVSLLVPRVQAQPQTFTDVPPDHPFYTYVERAKELGFMLGYGDGTFGVDDPLPRWQAAVVIVRALGVPNPAFTGTVFNDVQAEDGYFGGFVEELARRGITSGCGGGNFCPYEPATRAQVAIFVVRGLGQFGPQTPITPHFLDTPPGHFGYAFIEEFAARGITHGCGEGPIFCPDEPTTRGQMAVFVVRAFGNQNN